LKNIFSLQRNKKTIRKIIEETCSRGECSIAEYPPTGKIMEKIFRLLGLSYAGLPYRRILMMYSSMAHPRVIQKIKKHVNSLPRTQELSLGLGTIATGVLGTEPMLSPEDLEMDLQFAQDQNVESVAIFRLGGLDAKYIRILDKFLEFEE